MVRKNELAARYFPDQTRKQPIKIMTSRPALRRELERSGFRFGSKCKFFTNKEVEIIPSFEATSRS